MDYLVELKYLYNATKDLNPALALTILMEIHLVESKAGNEP